MNDTKYNTRIREYLTFGLGVHYLLKAIIIQFVALLLGYQFARPLTISVTKPHLFILIYTTISVIFVTITILFSLNMCRRSLSPKMHSLNAVIISTILYHLVAGAVVVSGYTLLIVAVSGWGHIALLDLFLSLLFTTAFAAILTVGYHDELDDRLPTAGDLGAAITNWIETSSWVDEPDNSQTQRRRSNAFEDSCDLLAQILSNAHTTAGEELAQDFESWVSDYNEHKGQGKELVLQGQKHKTKKNKRLQTEHQEFQRLKSRLQELSPRE